MTGTKLLPGSSEDLQKRKLAFIVVLKNGNRTHCFVRSLFGHGHGAGNLMVNFEAEIPIGRLGTPDEVAETVLWIVKTGYVTNKVVGVDGGWLLQ